MSKNKQKLNDNQLEGVNGGQKIIVIKSPKFISPILRLIFKIKKDPGQQTPPPNNEG